MRIGQLEMNEGENENEIECGIGRKMRRQCRARTIQIVRKWRNEVQESDRPISRPLFTDQQLTVRTGA